MSCACASLLLDSKHVCVLLCSSLCRVRAAQSSFSHRPTGTGSNPQFLSTSIAYLQSTKYLKGSKTNVFLSMFSHWISEGQCQESCREWQSEKNKDRAFPTCPLWEDKHSRCRVRYYRLGPLSLVPVVSVHDAVCIHKMLNKSMFINRSISNFANTLYPVNRSINVYMLPRNDFHISLALYTSVCEETVHCNGS